MLENNEHITISKHVETKNELDYSFLREIGLTYLEQFSSQLWTDFNSHDPGVTLLELLSYAITDLGARINLPIEDLLNNDDSNDLKQFFEAHEILPSHPVNARDYRKLFIDVAGVRNAWMLKYDKRIYIDCENDKLSYDPFDLPQEKQHCFKVKGLYRILLEFEDFVLDGENPTEINEQKESTKQKVKCLYHANRNLCEDLVDIIEVPEHHIGVCAQLELHPEADENLVNAQVIYALNKYLSPSVKFYSLQQMLDDGIATEEIFDGPTLHHGFIKDDELGRADLLKEVRLSDLINIIMDIPGIKLIKDISINTCGDKDNLTADDWRICIRPGHKAVLCEESSFSFFKDVLPLNIKQDKVASLLGDLFKNDIQDKEYIASLPKTLELKSGRNVELDAYSSVVHDLPLVYGVGEVGLGASETEARKSQAKQLKAYLLFFDQILANYMKQLHATKELLAVNNNLTSTTFAQRVLDLPNIEDIVDSTYFSASDEDFVNALYDEIYDNDEKVNQILDHLLARFSENFASYAFLMKKLYDDSASEVVTQSKQDFIQNYVCLSYNRGLSFNYCCNEQELKHCNDSAEESSEPLEIWDTENVSFFEKRLSKFLGINDYKRRNLSVEGVQIYTELDESTNTLKYRWRFRDFENNIIITATKFYNTLEDAHAEILLSKKLAEDIENFEIRTTESENLEFYIVLVDKTFDPSTEEYVVARRYHYFPTEEAAQVQVDLMFIQIPEIKNNESMYVIENILLLPKFENETIDMEAFLPICTNNCESCEELDPYSYRVTIALPGWTERFANMDFRKFMENMIREELPAHVMARICWIGHPHYEELEDSEENDMIRLEKAYKEFLEDKKIKCQTPNYDLDKLKSLIEAMNELNTIYPKGTLIDCEEQNNELSSKVVLGRTKI